MITVVSPRWMLDEVVVIVRVTLQDDRARAPIQTASADRIITFFIVLPFFLFEYGSHGFSRNDIMFTN